VDEQLGLAPTGKQPLGDVGPGRGIGRGGERHGLHVAERLARAREVAVLGPEIVAPLRDAVRFIDGEPPHAGALQCLDQPLHQQPLGRDEEQAQGALADAAPGLAGTRFRYRRVEGAGGDAEGLHLLHLVVHQRDQGRDDDGQRLFHQGGELVGHRLARTRRHHREDVAPVEHGADHLGLAGTEILVAEGFSEGGASLVEAVCHGCDGSARPCDGARGV
jgi:hypothetical protein